MGTLRQATKLSPSLQLRDPKNTPSTALQSIMGNLPVNAGLFGSGDNPIPPSPHDTWTLKEEGFKPNKKNGSGDSEYKSSVEKLLGRNRTTRKITQLPNNHASALSRVGVMWSMEDQRPIPTLTNRVNQHVGVTSPANIEYRAFVDGRVFVGRLTEHWNCCL
ncbi:hypothetical protein CIRG_07270 [Coccidioides immitis RMSCC 2394]|uniref:Uncharacterized protein n=1 Tax=Coccidioides immitis RMSCC 2394 TaxID=404692 RepID=A0A0J6YKG6_COCIT|nr:hypothetical protein CIRG_07270 [Coccidioides immitis RMSCC 2394]